MVRDRTALWLFLAYAVLLFFAFVYLYPFLVQVTTSFKSNTDAVANPLSPSPSRSPRVPTTSSPRRTSRSGSATR